ncbi:MAG: hypothetical protein WCY36_01645 [Candidatus Omnitrophota bacterium]
MDIRKFTHPGIFLVILTIVAGEAYCQDDSTRDILKQGLLGAGTGAIAAGATGGKAGQGALIGAGTNVIGGALLDMLTTPSSSSRRSAQSSQQYYDDQGEEYYEEPAQESSTQKVLKQGLLGAGTGAIAAGASGGNAGTGALIGAGTNVVGGALLDALTQPSQPKRVYRKKPVQQYQAPVQQNIQVQEEQVGVEGGKKKIVKHYDTNGKLVSEEEIYY